MTGTLRGFDQFMNLVLEDTIEEVSATERNEIGMVVCCSSYYFDYLVLISFYFLYIFVGHSRQ